jgi:hypothetical protein
MRVQKLNYVRGTVPRQGTASGVKKNVAHANFVRYFLPAKSIFLHLGSAGLSLHPFTMTIKRPLTPVREETFEKQEYRILQRARLRVITEFAQIHYPDTA